MNFVLQLGVALALPAAVGVGVGAHLLSKHGDKDAGEGLDAIFGRAFASSLLAGLVVGALLGDPYGGLVGLTAHMATAILTPILLAKAGSGTRSTGVEVRESYN